MSRFAIGCLASPSRTDAKSEWILCVFSSRGRSACPLVRPLGDGLFEVRTNLPDKTIARVLFCFHGGELFALHGFIKKTRRAPSEDLKLAQRRKTKVEGG